MSDLAACMSSENMGWQTPESFLDVVRRVGPIRMDPCTTEENPVNAPIFITPNGDGLKLPWECHGLVYCNPPYGRELKKWSAKMALEARRGAEIIGLVPARTDTRWWRDITTADAVCFWRGRIRFVGAKNGAPFPSAVPYWGQRPQEFRRIFEQHGWVVFSKQQQLFPSPTMVVVDNIGA